MPSKDKLIKQDLDQKEEFQSRQSGKEQLGQAPSHEERGPHNQQYSNQSKEYQDRGKKPKQNEGPGKAQQYQQKGMTQPSGTASSTDEEEGQKQIGPERGDDESSQKLRESKRKND